MYILTFSTSLVECPFYILHTSLWSTDLKTQCDLLAMDNLPPMRNMTGTLVSTPSLLKDLDNKKGYYFAFPDLSIKMTGQFKLKFSLIHMIR